MREAGQSRNVAIPVCLAILLLFALLFRFPPERYGFYPLCPIHQYTGWLCPGCGATRALAALLHGRVRDAMELNAFAVLLLPGIALYASAGYARELSGRLPAWPAVPRRLVIALLVAACGFTLMRNLL